MFKLHKHDQRLLNFSCQIFISVNLIQFLLNSVKILMALADTEAETSKAPDNTLTTLENLVPTYEFLASSSKIHLIQSLVSQILVTHVFSAYFVGLAPEQATELANVEKTLSNFGTYTYPVSYSSRIPLSH